MKKYTFMLNFSLPGREDDPEDMLDALYKAGCDDAAVGINKRGLIGFDFTRHADNAEEALLSAIRNVETAIPNATLVEAGPDLVGLSEMAEIFGFTRQNMRKYATGTFISREAFPLPVINAEASLWHLAEIAAWLKLNTTVEPSPEVLEISKVTAKLNSQVDKKRVDRILELA